MRENVEFNIKIYINVQFIRAGYFNMEIDMVHIICYSM